MRHKIDTMGRGDADDVVVWDDESGAVEGGVWAQHIQLMLDTTKPGAIENRHGLAVVDIRDPRHDAHDFLAVLAANGVWQHYTILPPSLSGITINWRKIWGESEADRQAIAEGRMVY